LHQYDSEIEKKTRGQSLCPLWAEERTKRIQSSMFGRICKATDRTDFTKLAASLVNPKPFTSTSVRHGTKYEPVAVNKYELISGKKTTACGLFVCEQLPFLGSSPDRVVDEHTLLEIKCPYSARNCNIDHVTVPYLILENGKLVLDTNHDYYYQVQGQLLCSGKNVCDLAIFTLQDFKIISIERNDTFLSEMVLTLKQFYENYFKQALIEMHLYKDSSKYTFNYRHKVLQHFEI